MLAARGFGLEPIGGLYSPLGASKEDRPRGLLDKEHKSTLIPGETAAHYGTDFKDPEGLEEILDQALAEATRVVGEIRAGRDRSQPAGRLLPDLVRIRSDLPGRARDPRARRGRGRGRGLMDGAEQLSFEAPPAEDPPSPAAPPPAPEREPPPASEPGRAPTEQQQLAIDNRDRDVFLEAGAGTGKTQGPGRPLLRGDRRRRDRAGPDPRLHLHREGGGGDAPSRPGRAQPPGRGRRRSGPADQAAGGRAGGRVGPDHDDPRILPAPARHPPGRGRPRSAVPGPRRRRGLADREILVRRGARGARRRPTMRSH